MWRIAFWIRLKRTRCSFSGFARAATSGPSHVGDDVDPARLALGAHRVDGLLDEAVEPDLLHAPVDVAGLDARQLEEVVDQRAQRADVGRHPAQVLRARLTVDEVVADGVGEQPQRGDRRAQVVRDRGDERAPRALRRVARALLLVEARDHVVRRRRELRQLVAAGGRDLHVAPSLADRGQPVAHVLDVAQDAAGEHLGGDDGDEARERDDQRHEHRVLVADEHQPRRDDDGDQRLADHDRHGERELPPQRAQAPAARGGEPHGHERGRRHRREHEPGDERGVPALGEADREGHDGQPGGDDGDRPGHGRNR